jgi:hypothetical protein
MKVEYSINLSQTCLNQMQVLRENHIDIQPVLQEEMSQILPELIENIIDFLYNRERE